MDFIEGLLKSEGNSVILVVVDRLSKYAHFIPLSHPYTVTSVADAFIKEVVRLHGIPEVIITDRDRVFLSHFWQHLFKGLGTALRRSSAYHPQTDGQTEVVNRSIGTYLRCFAANKQKDWVKFMPWAEYWYNTSFHTSAQTTPYKVLYGRDPPKLVPYEKGSVSVHQAEQTLLDRDKVLNDLKEHLSQARRNMKKQSDKRRRDISFKIQQRIGEVAYCLKLPKESQIYPVFHVSQLKPASGPPKDPSKVRQLKWFPGYDNVYEPEGLRGVRDRPDGREVLIKWTRLPEHETTWEPMMDINEMFPDFDLEDKVVSWGAGPDEFSHEALGNSKKRQAKEPENPPIQPRKGQVRGSRKRASTSEAPIRLEAMRLARDMSEESDQVTKMAKFDAPVEEVRVSRTDTKKGLDCSPKHPHTKAPWPDEDARGLSEVMPLPGLSKAPVHETVPMNEVRVPWDIRIYHGGT
ncbi:unnamed protein product [Rhodiola kirilowii]